MQFSPQLRHIYTRVHMHAYLSRELLLTLSCAQGRPVFCEVNAATSVKAMLEAGCTIEEFEFVQIRNTE